MSQRGCDPEAEVGAMSEECGQTVEVIRCGREFPAPHRGSSFMVTASIFIFIQREPFWTRNLKD